MTKRRREREADREPKQLTLDDMPFCRLIEEDEDLAEARRAYAAATAEERRLSAEWEYDAAIASYLVNTAVARHLGDEAPQLPERAGPCPGAVLALAIDPRFAPALLTVGSVEYQLGRVEEAMDLFLALPPLPPETEDLPVIIDKAGDFLLDQEDYENAEVLYAAAAREHPDVALYHGGLSYCTGELGEMDDAIAYARRAVELAPDDPVHLNDLGWALAEAGLCDEAEQVLEKAAALSPADNPLAKNNLEDVRRRLAENEPGQPDPG